jgi:hypothetical protein
MLIHRDRDAIEAARLRRLAVAKAEVVARVNEAVTTARRLYLPELPGQEMIYMAKETEALRYLSLPEPDLSEYPLLAAEVGLTAPSAHELAQIWANMGALWRQAAAQIEAMRMTALIAIDAAQNEADLDKILSALETNPAQNVAV